MAGSVYWKGYLKLSLVTCAVALTPATTEGERVRFRTLNRRTGNPLQSRWIDSASGQPVREEDEARGYPRDEDSFVLIEDEDLDAVRLESTRMIDISTFAPASSIGSIWFDQPYFLKPTDRIGAEAYGVIQAAMAATQTVGVSRLVLARRERAVILQPRGAGIVLWSLRFGDEVRDPEEAFAGIPAHKPPPKLAELVRTLIRERTAQWRPAFLEDPVQDRLEELIAARRKGRRRARKPEKAPEEGKVVDIMDALRRSLAAEKPR